MAERIKNAKIGEIIFFGTYPQTADGTDRTPIMWRVLQNSGKELFVLSEYILACRQYHSDTKPYQSDDADITWHDCHLRKWLNDDFYNTAFDIEQKNLIKTTHCSDNGEGCPDTDDKVFLLSVPEVKELTHKREEDKSSVRRCAVGTGFSKIKTVSGDYLYVYDKKTTEDYIQNNEKVSGCSWWWLRTQPGVSSRAYFIGTGSSIRSYGRVNLTCYGVRPAIRIAL